MEIPSIPCLGGNRDRDGDPAGDPATISSPVSRKHLVPITVVHFVGDGGFGVVVSSSHGSSLVDCGMGCPRGGGKGWCGAGIRPRGCGHCGVTRGGSAVGRTPLDAPGKPSMGISCGGCTEPRSGGLPRILGGNPAGMAPPTIGGPLRPSGGLPCCDGPGSRCAPRSLG